MDRKLTSMLALCQKAGKLVSGESTCEKTMQSELAKLVIVCEDASDNTKKKFINKSFFYKVPCYCCCLMDEVSHCIGKNNRATVIITDDNFANKIIGIFSEQGMEETKEFVKDRLQHDM